MCCNGTLYTYVTTTPDDLPRLAKHTALTLTVRNEQDTFDEPCVLHTGSACSIYEDRPATCSRYSCLLLRAAARDEVTEDEALLLIKEGKALVEIVKELIDFQPGLPLAISTWEAPPDHLSPEAALAWERTTYHLGKHFLGTVVEEVEPAPTTAAPTGSAAFAEQAERERQRVQRERLFTPAQRRA